MKKFKPVIEQFTNYPLIAVRNSYITIQWRVKNALFVYINNGIGLKRTKGIKLTTLNKSNTYKIKAFGFLGTETKYIYPITLRVNNKVPKPQLIKKEVEVTNIININNSEIKKAVNFKQINSVNVRFKDLKTDPDIEPLYNDLKLLTACETTEELKSFRDLIINE